MRRGAAAIALALLVAALGSTPAAAANPYQIHAILSLTGQGSFLGKEEAQAL